MVMTQDEFEVVRRDPDPVRRGQRAGELITVYQQRSAELARIRKIAIEEARDKLGLSYTEIATKLGITKGRITQIRSSAPRAERAFFGVGPVHIGVPLRLGTDDRMRTYIDASDQQAQDQADALVSALALTPIKYPIRPEATEPPSGDAVVICGPKSAPVGANLLSRDDSLSINKIDGLWRIVDQNTGKATIAPRNDDPPLPADLGYLARHKTSDGVVVHVAGISAIGSSGVLHYLTTHLGDLWSSLGDVEFSMVVRCEYVDDITITDSAAFIGPYVWSQ